MWAATEMAKRVRSAHGRARSTSYMPFDERLRSSARDFCLCRDIFVDHTSYVLAVERFGAAAAQQSSCFMFHVSKDVYMRPCRELPCTVSATADASKSTRVRVCIRSASTFNAFIVHPTSYVCTLCVLGAWRTHVWRPVWHPWPAAIGHIRPYNHCALRIHVLFDLSAGGIRQYLSLAARRRCGGATAGLAIEA